MKITVTNVDGVSVELRFRGATHVLSLLYKEEFDHLRFPPGFNKDDCWFPLEMNDVATTSHEGAPTKDQVKLALDWIKSLPADASLIIHCFAGISRSTAMALAAKVQEHGIEYIPDAIKWLEETRPIAAPNRVITKYADELLDARGLLHDAAEKLVSAKIIGFPLRHSVDSEND